MDNPEEILRVLAEENAKRRSGQKQFVAVIIGILSFIIALNLFVWIFTKQPPDFTFLASQAGVIGASFAFTAQHKSALEKAAKLARPEFVGYLAEAYATSMETDVTNATRDGLIVSLPLLQDPGMLDAKQRGYLYGQLGTHRPFALVQEVLGAMQRVAGSEALPQLEKFLQSAIKHKDPAWRRLGERALQVLPDVRIRAARAIIEAKAAQSAEQRQAEVERLQIGS